MKPTIPTLLLLFSLNFSIAQSGIHTTPDNLTPLTLVELGLENNGDNNAIEWTTFKTSDKGKFLIEHSISGRSFTIIGEINAKSDTLDLVSYSFNHTAPVPGLNYYRIRRVDEQGVNTYSKTLTTYNKSSAQLNAFPNPFTDLITIQTTEEQPWKLLDVHGNMILRGTSKEIKTNHLPAGTYFLLTQTGSTDYLLKMIKQ